MGFYIDLPQTLPDKGHFEETSVPNTFWFLYGILLFAVLCMGFAANVVLQDLFKQGEILDQLVLGLLTLTVPIVILIGVKLALIRKFVDFSGEILTVGYKFSKSGPILIKKTFSRHDLREIYLLNKKQSSNMARTQHHDRRYHIRGHWRVVAESDSRKWVLDRHTEREALEPLYGELKRWLAH